MSSVGKGVTSAAIGRILQSRGYRATNVKCDMYINIDAGTIRPTEHGEVFVGTDGIEADQDLGNYERFTGQTSTRDNYITTGQVYQAVIQRERNLEYDGEDVEVVPDIPNEIIRRITTCGKKNKAEIVVVEFGGTVGEYQVLLFLEAARMMKLKHPDDVAFVLVSYLPVPSHIGEMKTKPTQYAARSLNAAGIQADFVVCRSEYPLDERRRDLLATFCGIPRGNAIAAPDVKSIYEVPLWLEKDDLSTKLLNTLHLKPRQRDLNEWRALVKKIISAKKEIKIGIVGKYFTTGKYTLADSYISVIEAIKHAAWAEGRKPILSWIDSSQFEKDPASLKELSKQDGILVPGGFGARGVEGIIKAIQYARENNIPYYGLCYGMQLAAVELARHGAGLAQAHTTEVDAKTSDPIITTNVGQADNIKAKKFGATMRLGSYDCKLLSGSMAAKAYGQKLISERHRHRYEFNNKYRAVLEKVGAVFSGINPAANLVEIMELKDHPFFVGVQFHPEFQSRPDAPHPLFRAFIRAAVKQAKK